MWNYWNNKQQIGFIAMIQKSTLLPITTGTKGATSNSSLVAPVKIDENSIVGAGSVITKNVRKKSLALTRSSQIEIKNYKRKK